MEADQLLAVIRDMLLILLAITGVIVSVTISIVALLLYRKVSPIITAAKTTVDQAQETSSIISDKIVDIAAARNPKIGMKIVFTTMLRTVAITNERVIVRT